LKHNGGGPALTAADEVVWQQIVAERGDSPEPCCYCRLTTRPFSEWAAMAACTVCHGTMERPLLL
jgi:hypothetical protein